MNRPINYLGNNELLSEIHKSKISYCYFLNPEDGSYDLILKSVSDITPETILLATENRMNRINGMNEEKARRKGIEYTSISDIPHTDLVFRVGTYDHIPINEEKVKKAKKVSDKHLKVNFKPFKHYKLDETGAPIEVGRSHWVGGLENGNFSTEHGIITNRLASQFMLLVDRYSQKSNWRNYTYIEDMKGQALVQLTDSALKFDESVSENPFSYLTMCVLNTFRGVLNGEKRLSDIRNKIMVENGYDPSFEKQAEIDSE